SRRSLALGVASLRVPAGESRYEDTHHRKPRRAHWTGKYRHHHLLKLVGVEVCRGTSYHQGSSPSLAKPTCSRTTVLRWSASRANHTGPSVSPRRRRTFRTSLPGLADTRCARGNVASRRS